MNSVAFPEANHSSGSRPFLNRGLIFSAALAASGAVASGIDPAIDWTLELDASYKIVRAQGSYSSFEGGFDAIGLSSEEFSREVALIYAALSDAQEPLGREFEAVWDANVDSLYES